MSLKNLSQLYKNIPLSGVGARQFNGVDQTIIIPVDLSSYNIVTLCWWMWWDSYAADADDMAMEYSDGSNFTGAFIVDMNAGSGGVDMYSVQNNTTAHYWRDFFTRPSAATWHHYALIFDRTGPTNTAYVNGSSVGLTANNHFAGSYGNFNNFNLYVMSRANTALFGAGRVADVALYAGVAVSGANIATMASGVRAKNVRRANLLRYYPMGLASPEPDKSGNNVAATVVGATYVAGPPTLEEYVDDIVSTTRFSGSEVAERADSATVSSVTAFSVAETYLTGFTDAATITSTSGMTGTESATRTDANTVNPKVTFTGTDAKVITDVALFNPVTTFSGLDHICIYVPSFDVSAQTEFDVEEGNARTNFNLGIQKRFSVTAELSPGSNPC